VAADVASHVPAKAFPILFDDDQFMAINKPAGVAVHGGSGVSFGVIEQLRMAYPNLHYLELVHRLDRETSGVLLIAKRRGALKKLQDQFRERETGKTYLAMVLGQWPSNKRVLDKSLHKYLLPNGERRVKVVAKDDPDAMPSLTLVKLCTAEKPMPAPPVAALGEKGCSLLEVTIKTGRTHQIRVHLASEGMPILGDDKYGDFDCNKALARADQAVPLKRMFLHAWRFQCKHPLTGKRIALQADLPPELAHFLAHAAPGVGPHAAPDALPPTPMDAA
jgi:23S rRNA pseudouridine955/2504/2580 synthase